MSLEDTLEDLARDGYSLDEIGRWWTPGPLPGTQYCRDDMEGGYELGVFANERDLPSYVRAAFDELRLYGVIRETGNTGPVPESWLLPDGTRRYCLGRVHLWDVEPQPWGRDQPLAAGLK
ncbi:MAG: hypothetical protein ABL916_16275 [Burkholderiaceae bacterium]